jgi:transposase
MKAPIFIRALTQDERDTIQAGLRSSQAFVLRRCQILLASERKENARAIAKLLGCDDQTVRNVIKGFNKHGLAVLTKQSCRPHRLRTSIPNDSLEALQELLHRSPREFGVPQSLWSLPLLAKVAFSQGLLETLPTAASLWRALMRLGTTWNRAKEWINSPDPQYQLKKTLVTA